MSRFLLNLCIEEKLMMHPSATIVDCKPKTKAGETQPRSKEFPHGYTKRHGKGDASHTTNKLASDK
jgi:hypothetical protein